MVGYRTRLSVAHGAYVELHVEERHLSQYGVAHGVVALVLLDTVGGVHLLAARPELARLATISLSANFIGPVRPGRVLATAQIQRIGGAVGYTAMAPHAGDFEGQLLATAHGAYRLFHAGAGRALCLSAGPAPQSKRRRRRYPRADLRDRPACEFCYPGGRWRAMRSRAANKGGQDA